MESSAKGVVDRLRRVEGQLRGIQRMLEQGRVCEDVVTQLVAARNAIDQVAARVLEIHIQQCVFGGVPMEPAQARALQEALSSWTHFGPAERAQVGAGPGA